MSILLTPSAAERIRSHIAARGHGLGLRLGVRKSGCSGFAYVVDYADAASPQDLVFEDQGVKVFVDPDSLPANCRITHVSLFDGSLQGFERTDRPAFCFQGHPEASPGPHDIAPLFDRFVAMMEKHKHG